MALGDKSSRFWLRQKYFFATRGRIQRVHGCFVLISTRTWVRDFLIKSGSKTIGFILKKKRAAVDKVKI